MTDFALLFNEREGSTAMIGALDKITGISCLRTSKYSYEPFDNWNVTHDVSVMQQIIRKIEYRATAVDLSEQYRLIALQDQDIYYKPESLVAGFKARFSHHPWEKILKGSKFHVLMAFRDDIIAQGISRYHGNGSFREGHMQFTFKQGTLIEPFAVDLGKFSEIVNYIINANNRKKELILRLQENKIPVSVIIYEEFARDPVFLIERILKKVGFKSDRNIIKNCLEKQPLRKVHSSKLGDFIINFEDINKQFSSVVAPSLDFKDIYI